MQSLSDARHDPRSPERSPHHLWATLEATLERHASARPVATIRRMLGWPEHEWLHQQMDLRERAARTRQDVWLVVERIERWDRPLRAVRQGRRKLERFERALAAHIAREEADGHLERALDQAPRYSGRARRLHREHPELLREMRDVRLVASGTDVSAQDWADLYQVFDGFVERLRLHEEAENEIVSAAFLEDLGPGD